MSVCKKIWLLAAAIAVSLVSAACGNDAPVSAPVAVKADTKNVKFSLSEPAADYMTDKVLQNRTIHQSFAFDNVNKHIYFVQVTEGGIQLPGEKEKVSSADRASSGDLTLTRLDSTGAIAGHMYLKGFGHGMQIGVEPADNSAYIWMEAEAVVTYGTKLARFKFEDGKTLDKNSPELEKHSPIEGADRITVSIDPANALLTLRYRKDGIFQFSTFPLEEVKRKQYTPTATVRQPNIGTSQGFVSFGNYLYLLEGDSYESKNSPPLKGNTIISVIDLKTGKVIDKQPVTAGIKLSFREPEGLGIRIPDLSKPGQAELAVGFASGVASARMANLYTYNRLQPVTEAAEP